MPSKEQKLLKQLIDSLNKQPQYETGKQENTNPQQQSQETFKTGIPLRSIEDILKEQSDTKPK